MSTSSISVAAWITRAAAAAGVLIGRHFHQLVVNADAFFFHRADRRRRSRRRQRRWLGVLHLWRGALLHRRDARRTSRAIRFEQRGRQRRSCAWRRSSVLKRVGAAVIASFDDFRAEVDGDVGTADHQGIDVFAATSGLTSISVARPAVADASRPFNAENATPVRRAWCR